MLVAVKNILDGSATAVQSKHMDSDTNFVTDFIDDHGDAVIEVVGSTIRLSILVAVIGFCLILVQR